jgi:exopolysaccharide biosynthesis polyprenyl glycosylphosphotransferase
MCAKEVETTEVETSRVDHEAAIPPAGAEIQDVLFDLIVEPGIAHPAMPWYTEEIETPAASDKRKNLSILALRLTVDCLTYLCAVRIAYWLRFESAFMVRSFPPENVLKFDQVFYFMLMALPVLIFFMKVYGLYVTRVRVRTLDKVPKIAGAVTGVVITLLVMMFLLNSSSGFRGYIIIFWACCILLIFLGRTILQVGYSVMGRVDVAERNTLLVGAGQVGKALALKLARHPEFGLRPVGFIDDHPLIERFNEPEIRDLQVLGGLADICGVINTNHVEKVIVGFSKDSHESMLELISVCNNAGVEVSVLPRLFEVITEEVEVREIGGISMVPVRTKNISGVQNALKTMEDYTLCLIGLAIFWPVLLAIAIAIKLDSRGPVFYKQTRIGRDGRPFQFIKFRSMVDGADAMRDQLENGRGDDLLWKIDDDPRITRVGKWIRKFSLDETPQVFNVLKGEMSLVGPRPGLPEEVDKYKGWHRLRLKSRPGITGLWQVNGRSDLPFDEMVKFDLYYIECWSLWLDIKTILRTVNAVLHGKGAY